MCVGQQHNVSLEFMCQQCVPLRWFVVRKRVGGLGSSPNISDVLPWTLRASACIDAAIRAGSLVTASVSCVQSHTSLLTIGRHVHMLLFILNSAGSQENIWDILYETNVTSLCTLSKKDKDKLHTVQMKCFRQILNTRWQQKIRSEEVNVHDKCKRWRKRSRSFLVTYVECQINETGGVWNNGGVKQIWKTKKKMDRWCERMM